LIVTRSSSETEHFHQLFRRHTERAHRFRVQPKPAVVGDRDRRLHRERHARAGLSQFAFLLEHLAVGRDRNVAKRRLVAREDVTIHQIGKARHVHRDVGVGDFDRVRLDRRTPAAARFADHFSAQVRDLEDDAVVHVEVDVAHFDLDRRLGRTGAGAEGTEGTEDTEAGCDAGCSRPACSRQSGEQRQSQPAIWACDLSRKTLAKALTTKRTKFTKLRDFFQALCVAGFQLYVLHHLQYLRTHKKRATKPSERRRTEGPAGGRRPPGETGQAGSEDPFVFSERSSLPACPVRHSSLARLAAFSASSLHVG
jgi:hypothetical protein